MFVPLAVYRSFFYRLNSSQRKNICAEEEKSFSRLRVCVMITKKEDRHSKNELVCSSSIDTIPIGLLFSTNDE